jgi:hypothetical protein
LARPHAGAPIGRRSNPHTTHQEQHNIISTYSRDDFDTYRWTSLIDDTNALNVIIWRGSVDRAFATRKAAQQRPDGVTFVTPVAAQAELERRQR